MAISIAPSSDIDTSKILQTHFTDNLGATTASSVHFGGDFSFVYEATCSSCNTATTDAGVLALYINPTLSAPLTYNNNSRIQVALATNQTITAGTGRVIGGVPVTTSGGATSALSQNYLAWLSSTINNTHDEYVLGYMPITSNQSIVGIINLREH